VPYTIVRLIQFFEFPGGIAQSGSDGDTIRLSPTFFQPIALNDVAAAVSEYSVGEPVNGVVEIASPERVQIADRVQRFLSASHDSRPVFEDAGARCLGAELHEDTLVPGANARVGALTFDAWLARSQATK
jgi:hypothetical protein